MGMHSSVAETVRHNPCPRPGCRGSIVAGMDGDCCLLCAHAVNRTPPPEATLPEGERNAILARVQEQGARALALHVRQEQAAREHRMERCRRLAQESLDAKGFVDVDGICKAMGMGRRTVLSYLRGTNLHGCVVRASQRENAGSKRLRQMRATRMAQAKELLAQGKTAHEVREIMGVTWRTWQDWTQAGGV